MILLICTLALATLKHKKNGFIGINQDKKVYFIIKNGILECEHTKSATLHNGESYCDIF